MANSVLTATYDNLAHSLRVLLEADWRATRGGLLSVDRAEAVGNIETSLGSVWNAFHRLYDAMGKQLVPKPIDWYASGPLATILVLRNARHHNHAHGIRTLYNLHLDESEEPSRLRMYVFFDFPADDPTGSNFKVYLAWSDITALLNLYADEARIKPETRQLIEQYLGAANYGLRAKQFDLPESRIVIDVVPLIVNAAVAITPFVKPYVEPKSLESQTFLDLFSTIGPAHIGRPDVSAGPFALPD